MGGVNRSGLAIWKQATKAGDRYYSNLIDLLCNAPFTIRRKRATVKAFTKRNKSLSLAASRISAISAPGRVSEMLSAGNKSRCAQQAPRLEAASTAGRLECWSGKHPRQRP